MTDEELWARLEAWEPLVSSGHIVSRAGQDLRQAADRLKALTAENKRLRELLKRNIDDDPCWLDHHGYCQAHYLEEDCSVAAARAALEKQP